MKTRYMCIWDIHRIRESLIPKLSTKRLLMFFNKYKSLLYRYNGGSLRNYSIYKENVPNEEGYNSVESYNYFWDYFELLKKELSTREHIHDNT